MAEKGSDQMFAELADTGSLDTAVKADDQARAEEEARVSGEPLPVVDDEPGEQYPDPDEPPPPGEPHDEFDPLPPT